MAAECTVPERLELHAKRITIGMKRRLGSIVGGGIHQRHDGRDAANVDNAPLCVDQEVREGLDHSHDAQNVDVKHGGHDAVDIEVQGRPVRRRAGIVDEDVELVVCDGRDLLGGGRYRLGGRDVQLNGYHARPQELAGARGPAHGANDKVAGRVQLDGECASDASDSGSGDEGYFLAGLGALGVFRHLLTRLVVLEAQRRILCCECDATGECCLLSSNQSRIAGSVLSTVQLGSFG